MGQRLNIEIVHGDTSLANCYYHWSGYSTSAAEITEDIIDTYEELKGTYEDNVLFAIKLLEATGAGLTIDELTMVENSKYSNCQKAIDRNSGLIGISEEYKETTRRWEEARVTIDIKNEIIQFDAVSYYDKMDIAEWDMNIKFDELPIAGISISESTFEDFHDVAEVIYAFARNGDYYFREFDSDTDEFVALIA